LRRFPIMVLLAFALPSGRTGQRGAAAPYPPSRVIRSITWHWELMFTRPIYEPADDYQHRLLEAAAALIDAGTLRTTMTRQLGPLNAATLREAHRLVESGATIGKLVVTVAD